MDGDEGEGGKGRRKELAHFLRTRRERITPEQAGLTRDPRRRTPGLRREEVAWLTGVGITWYTWLEQGRDISVSGSVLTSLARVLRLNEDEQIHLFTLAQRERASTPAPSSTGISALYQEVLTALEPYPAYIRNENWDVIAWNRAELIVNDWETIPPTDRNVIFYIVTHPWPRRILVDWETHARILQARFRTEYDLHADDPRFIALLARLLQNSPEFSQWWDEHEVLQQSADSVEFQYPQMEPFFLKPIYMSFKYDMRLELRILMPLDAQSSITLCRLYDDLVAARF